VECSFCQSDHSAERELHRKALKDMRDEELIVRFQGGCSLAFDELYTRYFPRLVAYFNWRNGFSGGDAEDTANSAFVRVIQCKKEYHPNKGLFAPWLYRIAMNTAFTAYRRIRAFVSLALVPEPAGCDELPEFALRKCVQGLPCELKAVIELTFFAGLTDREAGEALGIPAGTVASRKHRALTALKDQLSRRSVSSQRASGSDWKNQTWFGYNAGAQRTAALPNGRTVRKSGSFM
jgi:RNA polymerase sigma-70 factor, ECF subfamily